MTTILANVIEDSVSEENIRLTTMLLRYPRFIHAELMTHRVFSRNASSSRAIPVERMIEDILQDTAMPLFWSKNQPGMQGYKENFIEVDGQKAFSTVLTKVPEEGPVFGIENLTTTYWSEKFRSPKEAWNDARDRAIELAKAFANAGYHKQIVNRLLEPFMHINVLVTATDWDNFYGLRDHPDAEPHIQMLAKIMRNAQDQSIPNLLKPGEWHLPFVSRDNKASLEDRIKISVARAARTSYRTHDGRIPSIEEDLSLANRLIGSEPLHASPAEHQATPDKRIVGTKKTLYAYGETFHNQEWESPELHGNFRGWNQYRKTLPNENICLTK